ncbi:MAG: glycosyltransferase [Flavobacteriales bacterium]|nr:glycosyltransferase [Flavobacteriales bacterium]
MKKNPAVSVILPVCNAEKTIERSVLSIINQSFQNWELLLLENGSTDSTSEKCLKLSKSDERISYYSLEPKGLVHALNQGILLSKAPLIARMDADDFSLPERLEKQYQFLQNHPETGLISGLVLFDSEIKDAEGYHLYVHQINRWKTANQIRKYRLIESPFAHPSVMFRKSLIDLYGLYSTDPIPEDYELWLRWMNEGVIMNKLDEPILIWNDSPSRLSRNHNHYSQEAFDHIRYYYVAEWLKKNRTPSLELYVWGGGKKANQKLKMLSRYISLEISGIIDVKPTHKETKRIHYSEIPPPGKIFILSMVSNRGKYAEIESFLESRGYEVEKDFILAG